MFTFTQQDNNTTTGTSYNAGSCPDNTTFGTQGSIARVYNACAKSTHTHTIGQITDLHVGSYVYNYPGTGYNSFSFTDTNAKGFSYIVVSYQDAGFEQSIVASLNSSTGVITIRINYVCDKTIRVSYICFK